MIGAGISAEPDLLHFEQQVNERLLTDPVPVLPPDLLPEAGTWHPMYWVSLSDEEFTVLGDEPGAAAIWRDALRAADGTMMFPLHPLMFPKFADRRLTASGRYAVSASYRTVFFEPETGSPMSRLVPTNCVLMIKLHLDEPLPGIQSDRRLSRDKVRKCLELSSVLPGALLSSRGSHQLSVLRERVGLLASDRGAIIRVVPRTGLMPLFSLYSRDRSAPGQPVRLLTELRRRGMGAKDTAEQFGTLLAEPLWRGLFAGADQGFALEMHGQNTLISIGTSDLIDQVLFRDLEGVAYFHDLRQRRGHPDLSLDVANPEFQPKPLLPSRWFSRNFDHDIGRSLRLMLDVLVRDGFFSEDDRKSAIHSCRRNYRQLLREFGLQALDRPWGWLPISRAPYGTPLRPGGYFRTTFR